MRKSVTAQHRRMFRPEFLNRVDAQIVFSALSKDEIKQIVDLEVNKVRERLIEHAITLEMTDDSRDWLADKGYDPAYGARPLKRVIQKAVQDPLAEMILSGKIRDGEKVVISANRQGITFNGEVAAAAA
jgi:ATP-dependent Clp protease ATP-binding subunit ClpB